MLSASFGISLQSRFESPRFLRTRRAASGLLDLKLDGRNGYVFGEGERPFALSTVYVRARAAWRAAGLTPIGLYEARHTCASLMIAVGVNAKAITHYLGHSSIEVTFDRYGHLMRQSAPQTVDFHGLGWTERRAAEIDANPHGKRVCAVGAEGEGFEPSSDLTARNGFRDRRIRPLCHPSRPTRGGVRGGEGGIRTLEGGMNPLNALAGRCLQPLGHFSGQFRRTGYPIAERRIPVGRMAGAAPSARMVLPVDTPLTLPAIIQGPTA